MIIYLVAFATSFSARNRNLIFPRVCHTKHLTRFYGMPNDVDLGLLGPNTIPDSSDLTLIFLINQRHKMIILSNLRENFVNQHKNETCSLIAISS